MSAKNSRELKSIFLAGFLLSLQFALTAYINSSFLSIYLPEKAVGLLYTLGAIISIAALMLIPEVLRKLGGYKFLFWSVGLQAISLLLLSASTKASVIIPAFVLYLALGNILIFSLDEILHIFSKNEGVGKMRGFYIAISSGAWVLAQTVSGTVLSNFSFSALYFISFSIMALFFAVSILFLKNLPDPRYDRAPVRQTVKMFFRNENLTRAYKINFLLQFFYGFMVIYTPIYLNAHLGFSWGQIGVIFAIMLTPFVLLPIPLGKYSDRIGERKMLLFGFALAALTTMSLFLITSREVWLWALLLFATRVGASDIETMSDAYFFKHITPANDEFIGVYRNAAPAAYLVAPLVAFLIFTFTPSFNFIYPVLGAFMLYGVYLASTIRKNDI